MSDFSVLENGVLPVDRREGLSQHELKNEYQLRGRPVVVDLAKDWPAMGKWTPDFFRKQYGHIEKEVDGRTYTIAEQMDLIERSTPENPAPYPYNFDIWQTFPELMADLQPQLTFGRPDRIDHPLMPRKLLNGTTPHEIFFGGKGAFFPVLHYDLLGMATQITQVHGDKEFLMYPPEESEYMYPDPDRPNVSRIGNMFTVDIERFPLFRKAKPYQLMLRQGETLFFPPGWWHATRIYGPSITYGRAVLNSGNWSGFVRENKRNWSRRHPMLAVPGAMGARLLGAMMAVTERG